jgi:plasmid stability protein
MFESVTLTVRVPKSMLVELRERAAADERSTGAVVRRLLQGAISAGITAPVNARQATRGTGGSDG